MPVKSSVNLIPREEVKKREWEKFLNWVLTYGRYIIIGTEIIVLSAFLLRFKLDRELKTLSDKVKTEQTIIESFKNLEAQTRTLQVYLNDIKTLQNQSLPATNILNSLAALTPLDVTFSQLKISPSNVNISATALSLGGFSSFIDNLKRTKEFRNISLEKVKEGPAGIEFAIQFNYQGVK